MQPIIRPVTDPDIEKLNAHFERHRRESGRGDIHFMPFEPDDMPGPRGLATETLDRALDEPGWQRWFIALSEDESQVVGHVDLKGDHLGTGAHRCELGIGIERAWRGAGLGRRLMNTALDFAREQAAIGWVDLRVFGHNAAAIRLYRDLGFTETGTLVDRFRIEGESIDDIIMTLDVR